MERWVAKLIASILIFTLMTIAGLLPIKVSDWYHRKGAKGEYYISILNCFGGGVFFGTYLMHMAPEVREILDEYLLTPNNIIYPLPELAIGFGFFLLLFVDKFVTIIAHNGMSSNTAVAPYDESMNNNNEKAPKAIENGGLTSDPNHAHTNDPALLRHAHLNSPHDRQTPPPTTEIVNSHAHLHHQRIDSVSSRASQDGKVNGHANPALEMTAVANDSTANNTAVLKQKEAENSLPNGTDKQLEDSNIVNQELSNEDFELAARPYVFFVALSIDCIFEGMSLGLQDTTYGVWMLVIAILSHELVITFSFGLRLVRLFSTRKTIIIIVSYASTIPIGIIIGLAIYETGGGSSEVEIVSGFFQGISGGIFIYITFLEILNEELTRDTDMGRPVAVLLGFLFMASIVLVENIGGEEDGDVDHIITTMSPNITGIFA